MGSTDFCYQKAIKAAIIETCKVKLQQPIYEFIFIILFIIIEHLRCLCKGKSRQECQCKTLACHLNLIPATHPDELSFLHRALPVGNYVIQRFLRTVTITQIGKNLFQSLICPLCIKHNPCQIINLIIIEYTASYYFKIREFEHVHCFFFLR